MSTLPFSSYSRALMPAVIMIRAPVTVRHVRSLSAATFSSIHAGLSGLWDVEPATLCLDFYQARPKICCAIGAMSWRL